MDAERWRKIKEIFTQAMEQAPGAREAFVEAACRGDGALRAEVIALLNCPDEVEAFLEPNVFQGPLPSTPSGDVRTAVSTVPALRSGVPGYEIMREIGKGGMGVVYEAVQKSTRGTVALKLMKSGITSLSMSRRFEHEAQILAHLRHPNVAQVYEAGTYRESEDEDAPGIPFFAMEYIPDAQPITDFARREKLSVRRRLELFAKVCDAVHHGHQKGIIHRDLKPGNILIDSNGEPKIIDFGVARSTDRDLAVPVQTHAGQLMGTLPYMSPEQCGPDPQDMDVRSDVYALGVVLYELLCERLPYDVPPAHEVEVMRAIREEPPHRPSTVNRTVRGDIETITLKALEKERDRRYRSAAELGDDIRRYLHSEPIVARPPSVMYQVKMFARRNRVAFGAGVAVLLMMGVATVVSLRFAVQAHRAEQRMAVALSDAQNARAAAESAWSKALDNLALAEEREEQAEREAEIAQALNEFVAFLLQTTVTTKSGKGRDVLMGDVLDLASKRIEEESRPGGRFADKPLAEASIRAALGVTYLLLGEPANAEPHVRRECDLRIRELGEEDPDTLLSMDNLAHLCLRQGHYDEAEAIFVRGLDASRRGFGEEHSYTLSFTESLGSLYLHQGRYDEAEQLYVRMLEISEPVSVFGQWDPNILDVMGDLAIVYRREGRYAEEEAIHVRQLDASRRLLGEEHPYTLGSMYGLARLYCDQRRYDQAEPLGLEFYTAKVSRHGAEHSETIDAINLLIDLYTAWHEAEPEKGYDAKAAQWRAKLAEANQMQNEDGESAESGDS